MYVYIYIYIYTYQEHQPRGLRAGTRRSVVDARDPRGVPVADPRLFMFCSLAFGCFLFQPYNIIIYVIVLLMFVFSSVADPRLLHYSTISFLCSMLCLGFFCYFRFCRSRPAPAAAMSTSVAIYVKVMI